MTRQIHRHTETYTDRDLDIMTTAARRAAAVKMTTDSFHGCLIVFCKKYVFNIMNGSNQTIGLLIDFSDVFKMNDFMILASYT